MQQVAERLDRLGSLVEQWAPEEPVGEAVDARLAALEAGLGSLVDVVEQLSAEIATLRRRLPVQAKAAGLPKAQLEAIAAEVVARMLDTFEVDDVEPAPPAPAAEPAPTRRRRSPLSARER